MLRSSRTLLVALALLSLMAGSALAQQGGGYVPSGGTAIHPAIQVVNSSAPKTRSYYIELLTRLALRMTRSTKVAPR